MKRILLAVGETFTSVQVARQVRPWLRERGTSLALLAVVPSESPVPSSPFKRTLEQVKAIFAGDENQPDLMVRACAVPATAICIEVREGGYDLLALGLRGEHRSASAVGETYQAVLHACPVSLFVVPPDAPVRLTPQILVIVTRERPVLALADWLVEQCLAQRLNVVFCASSAQDAKPADALFRGAGVRTQIVVRPGLFPEDISLLERERRVRWIAAPGEAIGDVASPFRFGEELLTRARCPVFLVREDGSN